ncbi:MAG: DUF1929 domain-containing protein [Propionibacteriales bacterium]|nr:DUF1929 domain-containing protein [Propionibacteriales bacterium]
MKATPLRCATFLGIASLAISLSVAAPSHAASLPAPLSELGTDPALVGEWSAPFDIGGIAIHATLTHNGDVLFFQYVEGQAGVDHTSYAATWNYRTGATAQAPFPYQRDVFCAGNNVLPDGRVYIAGGHDHTTGKKQDAVGVAETDTYDPTTRTWSPGPLLSQKRWYPTNIGLPNGRTLTFGGQAQAGAASNAVDEYNPDTNTMTQLASTATKPVGLYPRMHVMPNGKVLKTGPQRMSAYFNPATSSWSNVASMLYGSRGRGNSVLLPGADRVLVVGGQSSGSATPTGTAEIIDTSVAAPKWRYTGSLNYPRLLANTVNLPDGQVLIVGGGAQFKYVSPVKIPELYNPATETWTALAPQQASRMYHSTALLLPDGRVLSAGQDDGPLATYGEIFSPPYLFKGPRPTISDAPSTIGYGQQLTIASPNATDIASVTLIKAGSVTHQIDTDQRSVPLSFTATDGALTAQAPPNANVAPPGYYMLFIVDNNGVPSIAPWTHVG